MNKKYEEMGTNLHWIKKILFAGVFFQENRLHAVFDRYNDMSVKQWLLLATCQAYADPPDLSTLAETMGCSRQNVKKIAVCLERDGYVTLEKSPDDARALSVKRTEKGIQYSKEREEFGKKVHEVLYEEFTEEEIEQYYRLWLKMMKGIDHLEDYFKKTKMN
ncbi:transcriptional regulator, MarR family [Lachnospiraceae bacterium KM106-2]|nr:transcriptional regulator, MarR family [Lachnospiraceae bacterium KM106-2]